MGVGIDGGTEYSIYRLSVLSAKLGPPHPLTRTRVLLPPPLGLRGGDTLARGRGAGGTYSEEGTDTVVSLYTVLLFGWRYERRRWGSSDILSKL